jgi:hypothetical protein
VPLAGGGVRYGLIPVWIPKKRRLARSLVELGARRPRRLRPEPASGHQSAFGVRLARAGASPVSGVAGVAHVLLSLVLGLPSHPHSGFQIRGQSLGGLWGGTITAATLIVIARPRAVRRDLITASCTRSGSRLLQRERWGCAPHARISTESVWRSRESVRRLHTREGDWSAYETALKGATMQLWTTHEPRLARPTRQVRSRRSCTQR